MFPIEWCNSQNNHIIDIQDYLKHSYVSLSRDQTGKLSLCTTTFTTSNSTQFPIFASARTRKKQPQLQATATAFVNNLENTLYNDIQLWSDASVRKHYQHGGTAILIKLHDKILHTHATRLNTHDIALAELCGILLNLHWLYEHPNITSTAHILCDNQYAIKACLELHYPHIKHILIVQKILQLYKALNRQIKINFHWIPSHTDNATHARVDKDARECINKPYTALSTITALLCKHTDALASGEILSH